MCRNRKDILSNSVHFNLLISILIQITDRRGNYDIHGVFVFLTQIEGFWTVTHPRIMYVSNLFTFSFEIMSHVPVDRRQGRMVGRT